MLRLAPRNCIVTLHSRFSVANQPARQSVHSTICAAMKASWNGQVVAESDETVVVEGNQYFPPSSIKKEFFVGPTSTHTTCGWKGVASYYTIKVGDKENKDAAWFYPEPKEAANNIKGYVAFWKGVQVSS